MRRHKYVYVLHCRTLIYVRQKLTNLKDNIQVTIIIGDVNTSFSLIVRTSKQEANQSAKDISWLNGICKTLYPTLAEHTSFSFFF